MEPDLTYKEENLKTSKEWMEQEKYSHVKIMDPDGWDRKNFNYSFNEELITEIEFNKRKCMSTCMINNIDKSESVKTDYIINERALFNDTVTILTEHYGLDEAVVIRALGNNQSFMESMVTEMYSAQENYIANEHEKLIGELNE